MNLEFSNTTAALLKEQLAYEQLAWTTENTLDRASIKKLKGCRDQLVEDCLKLISQLDNFSLINAEKKPFSSASILELVESLKTYLQSSKRYPRLKKFLNFIPDNTDGIIGFILIATSLLSIVSPPFASIPVGIFFWILMDLSFNNRKAAKTLQESLYSVENKLRKIQEVEDYMLKNEEAPAQSVVQTPLISQAGPSTSYSAQFYGSTENNQDELTEHPSTSHLTLN